MGTSALPYGHGIPFTCQAKAAIDNCRAGSFVCFILGGMI